MKRYQKILFPVIIAAQIAVLGIMIARQEMLLAHGAKIILKCRPIDPRSMFSGDYVNLNYEISVINEDILKRSGINDIGRFEKKEIFVALKKSPEERYYSAAAVSHNINDLKKLYPVIIKGRVEFTDSALHIRYGVESYFVPQNEGKIIESSLNDVTVEVSVSQDGNSAISRLFLSGKEVRFY